MMARRSKYHFDYTMGEAHEKFSQLLASVGGQQKDEYYARVLALKIDGVPISETQADQRKPGSSFYGQGFVEALSVARILVSLDMDETVIDIKRQDEPDVCVLLRGGTQIYIEHTSVAEHDGLPFNRYLDETNSIVRRRLAVDERARAVVEAGFAEIRLTDPGASARPKPKALASDVLILLTQLAGEINLMRPDPARYPTLADFQAHVFYRPGRLANTTICHEDAKTVDPLPAWVGQRLRSSLSTKIAKAKKYLYDSRLLWLLMTLEGESLYPPFVKDLVAPALNEVPLAPFDRVIVWNAGCRPIVFEARDFAG